MKALEDNANTAQIGFFENKEIKTKKLIDRAENSYLNKTIQSYVLQISKLNIKLGQFTTEIELLTSQINKQNYLITSLQMENFELKRKLGREIS